jgi:cytochrome o ubiquinol oxidase subunit 1
VGFYLAFMPLYVLGAAGVPRRRQELFDPAFRPWVAIAFIGALLLFTGLVTLFIQLWVSVKERQTNPVPVGDPWDARGLEWSISAPPPEYNFATIPHVSRRDAFYWRKVNHGAYKPADHYQDIEMPKNSMCGVAVGMAAAAAMFGLVWHIWWLAAVSAVVTLFAGFVRAFRRDLHRTIAAVTVEAHDRRWLAIANAAQPVFRELESTTANQGLACLE